MGGDVTIIDHGSGWTTADPVTEPVLWRVGGGGLQPRVGAKS